MKTGEYTLPAFRHDWAAMNLSLFAGSAFFKAHGEELKRHGCAFAGVDRPFASSFPDGTWAGVSTRMEETLAGIGALSPEDAEAWKRLVAGFGAEAPHLFGLLGCAASKRAVASLAYKTLRAKGLGGTLDMGRFLIASPRQWLEETFSHGHVRAMLGAWGHAPRLCARRGWWRTLPLSRRHGGAGLRHGAGAGWCGYGRNGAHRSHHRARRDGGMRRKRAPHPA